MHARIHTPLAQLLALFACITYSLVLAFARPFLAAGTHVVAQSGSSIFISLLLAHAGELAGALAGELAASWQAGKVERWRARARRRR